MIALRRYCTEGRCTKTRLIFVALIREELPEVLSKRGGRVDKDEAREIVHAMFRKKFRGWPATLDVLEASGMPRWKNAWGWGTRRLSGSKVIEECTGHLYYALAHPKTRD
jgi:hypothetical protein